MFVLDWHSCLSNRIEWYQDEKIWLTKMLQEQTQLFYTELLYISWV
jgi:hypothetical protein